MNIPLLDSWLNKINMYQLTLVCLGSLLLVATLLSFLGLLPYDPLDIIFSVLILTFASYFANLIFAKLLRLKANPESAFITALILAMIVGPMDVFENILVIVLIAIIAMASKYLFVWSGRHIFNPAAIAVVISAIILSQGASWWIGSSPILMPFIVVFGLILLKKIHRFALAFSFLISYIVLLLIFNLSGFDSPVDVLSLLWGLVTFTPILFFTFIMFIEPQTSPKRFQLGIVYAIFTAIILVLYQKYLSVPYTLELALLTGNIFAYILSKEQRSVLKLKEIKNTSLTTKNFLFTVNKSFSFIPGQFLEWTLYHPNSDSRGIRRYFTIASSPTEPGLLLTTKFFSRPSTFKKALLDLKPGDNMVTVGPQGDFILPDEVDKKLVFIAGGVGITPFRSMVKYLLDSKKSRDIVLLYGAENEEDLIFNDLFERAREVFSLRPVYVLSNKEQVRNDWEGYTGYIDKELIQKEIHDWKERLFYVSGPEPMVRILIKTLTDLGVRRGSIKCDYFPGYQ